MDDRILQAIGQTEGIQKRIGAEHQEEKGKSQKKINRDREHPSRPQARLWLRRRRSATEPEARHQRDVEQHLDDSVLGQPKAARWQDLSVYPVAMTLGSK